MADVANMGYYPPVGFFFKISIDGLPDSESEFQEVTGLSVTVETQQVVEGGENRFVHQLPLRAKSEKLVLKRGLRISSGLHEWCRKAVEDLSFSPKNIHVFLLNPGAANPNDNILMSWHVIHAYPVKWSVSAFNAMENNLAIETIELQYNHFRKST
jgi:phage tail-like protein